MGNGSTKQKNDIISCISLSPSKRVAPNPTLEKHKNIVELNLKIALSHSTVARYFRDYCQEVGCEKLLEFYFLCIEIRENYYKNHNITVAVDLFNMLIRSSMDPLIKKPPKCIFARLMSKNKEFLSTHPQLNMEITPSNIVKSLQVLRFTQHEVLNILKRDHWLPFCESNHFEELVTHEDVGLLHKLYDSPLVKNDVVSGHFVPFIRFYSSDIQPEYQETSMSYYRSHRDSFADPRMSKSEKFTRRSSSMDSASYSTTVLIQNE